MVLKRLLNTWKYTQVLSVCGEQNGNRRLHADAAMLTSGSWQMSFWKYHLSVYRVGGLNLTLFVALPLGLVRKLLIIFFFFLVIRMPGCRLGPVTWLSLKGGFLLYLNIKSHFGCLYRVKLPPRYLTSSRSLLDLLQVHLCLTHSSNRVCRVNCMVLKPPPKGSYFL